MHATLADGCRRTGCSLPSEEADTVPCRVFLSNQPVQSALNVHYEI